MNVSIVTLNGFFNYGNRLQLFALSKTLEFFADDTTVYWPRTRSERTKEIIKYCFLSNRYRKESRLWHFTISNISKIKGEIRGIEVHGSDQIWNPNYYSKTPYLLDVSSSKAISYAASIGTEKLNNEQKKAFSRALKSYRAISVREQSAKDLLQPLTDKKIEVVLDPTLLLGREEYERLEKKPKNLADMTNFCLWIELPKFQQNYLTNSNTEAK